MATAPRTRNKKPAPATRRPRPSSAGAARPPYAAPLTDTDQRRWFDFRAGTSAEELAARENVKLDTIMQSLARMRAHQERHSQSATETAVRQMFLERLPQASDVFIEAMKATQTRTKTEAVREFNEETGTAEWVEKEVTEEIPDHKIRLSAVDALQKLLVSIQPKTPMVTVDARSQTNIGAGVIGDPASQQRALSFESIMRQRRLEMGLADIKELTAGGDSAATETAERDMDDDGVDDDEDGDADADADDGTETESIDGEVVDYAEDTDASDEDQNVPGE